MRTLCVAGGFPFIRGVLLSSCRHSTSAATSTDASPSSSLPTAGATDQDAKARSAAARAEVIDGILQRDKEIFTLKRQHELSLLRIEQHQNRILKDQEDRGIYYEQNCNVHTFDTISVGLYSQRNTWYHTAMVQRLRETKIGLTLLMAASTWVYLYFRYMMNPDMLYVEEPTVFIGSRALVVKEAEEKRREAEERRIFVETMGGALPYITPSQRSQPNGL